ncbi:ClpP/crotonase-like domain-containing protein [Zychaea mexicana]|uniref:ClpP/crotonase-like domain-containing protein n=1 Tax=Zychaea mexicana TaxID=64656 RepID=UPI0022FE8EA3|nr:ClpP/crotonase-like domain-containing protein [Zychaea mexicana]KAI9493854.1 ClpP/crotonase-like domain-containing protein [Zychaea mexicana]
MAASAKYQYKNLRVQVVSDGVAHVELHRPERLNAINEALVEDIRVCFNDLGKDSSIRCIILSGSGRTFTAGLDFKDNFLLKEEPAVDVARRAYHKRFHIEWFQSAMSALEKCPQPVIVAMHQGVYGVAVDLCTAGDIRYGTKDSFYTVKEVDMGLAPDVGTLQRLPKVINSESLARELCFTGRLMYADEAYKCGLISRIFENKEQMIEAALETARIIASKSPVAVVSSKHLLNYSRDHSVDEGLQYTAVWNSAMLQTEDIPKSIEAFLKKKPASYSKL